MKHEVLTVGHSTRALGEFLALLEEFGVEQVVDVRRLPVSRRHPHFAKDILQTALAQVGVAYVHEPDLGGHRIPRADTSNAGWRDPAFRGYADHMESAAFAAALDRVRAQAVGRLSVLLCAEADPFRCHRQLLADALTVRGEVVRHVLERRESRLHQLTPGAQVVPGGRVRYPGATRQRSLLDH